MYAQLIQQDKLSFYIKNIKSKYTNFNYSFSEADKFGSNHIGF